MSSHRGGTAATTATIISPVVPHKRQRPDLSPAADWSRQTADPSSHQHSPDARWSERRTCGDRDSKPDGMTRTGPPAFSQPDSWRSRVAARSGTPTSHHDHHERPAALCPVCEHVAAAAPRLVSGLDDLENELSKLSVSGQAIRSTSEVHEPPESPRGLLQALDWGIERLHQSVQMTKDVIAKSQTDKRSHPTQQPSQFATHSFASERNRIWESNDEPRGKSRYSPPVGDAGRRTELPPLFTEEQRREQQRSGNQDGGLSLPGNTSPPPASQGTSIGRAPTPTDNGRSRMPTLPSPASLSVTSSVLLPPMSPSLGGGSVRSPRTAHLEDLQHQLSTKTLAHQILSGEHEKLLSAYSRLQTRCATLDKKSTVSDAEIANLAEERIRLQGDLEVAETRVAELQALQEESRKQHAAHGEQYMQIMSLSSQLQAKGATEMNQWKADRETWEVERDGLLAKVKELQELVKSTSPMRNNQSHPLSPEEGTTAESLRSASPGTLGAEVMELRRRLKLEQERLSACKAERSRLANVIRELNSIGETLAGNGDIEKT